MSISWNKEVKKSATSLSYFISTYGCTGKIPCKVINDFSIKAQARDEENFTPGGGASRLRMPNLILSLLK